jgi:NAD+ kinase
MSAPQRLALCGDDLPRAAAAVRRAGLTVVRRDPEVVLCHGGDGTLLRAEREWPRVPKCPVRVAGRARPCPEHGLDAVLARLARGELPREELPLLECVVGHLHLTAVNDVVLRNESPATAVRLRVRVDGEDSGEVTGDGIVCATPFGSSGYYRSITRATFDAGLGLAFNNSTEPRAPLVLDAGQPVEVELLRGPAVLVHDNDPRSVFLREGQHFRVSLSKQTAVVLGLDSLRCQRCRKPDGSVFNPH